ncbi:TVP38/TMEM64 family membrane protein slr0305 [Geodia barretti]|uniref:TVP38/TMEM64 family membrane protein slr0305 n=1 Tax=Geodia barretti TaxID=519541 RepID=A0AA35T1V8_GEOBA|nr:TVP38/TMEM64 family membrane protein slr0305 [Geodia barretti]
MLSGLAFGPVWGVVYASIGAIIGVSCAFLVARYVARGMVEGWVKGNTQFRRIDEGVHRQGWRMLMVTRLVHSFRLTCRTTLMGSRRYDLPLLFCLMDLHVARHRCLRPVGGRGERR